MKIPAPNFTQTPNELFDTWLPKLKEVELKVLLVIMRKTFGWHKVRDRISLSQLSEITGCERARVAESTKTLVEKGLITKTVEGPIGKQVTYYELVIEEDSNNSDQCSKDTPPSAQKAHTKETHTKDNVRTQQAANVQNCVPQKTKATTWDNTRMPQAKRPIPHFLKEMKCFSDPDKQKLANAFSEQILNLALEECRSWARDHGTPDSMIAFMWSACKRSEKRYGSVKK